jgi:hypothetical protein
MIIPITIARNVFITLIAVYPSHWLKQCVACCEKYVELKKPCPTVVFSVKPEFSVSLWLLFVKKVNHGDTKNSEVSQRRSLLTDFSAKAS